MASSSGSPNVCFNSTCNQAMEVPRQGWLCRTGDFADLCDRCASAFKDGKFCDTYHLNDSGWRCCESCGKQIHCGCIVSFHMFILLDAGGIECLSCAKTEYILTPNPTWPSASHILHGPAERIRDVSSNNLRYIAGSGPVPWRQAPTLFNSFKDQHELQLTSYSLSQSTTDDPCERFVNDSWRVSAPEMVCDRAQATGIQYNGKPNLFKGDSYQSFFQKNATPLSSFPETFVPHDQKVEKGKASRIHVQRLCPPPSLGKQCSNNNGTAPSLEHQTHDAKAQGETRARHQLLPRYWPQFTGQELQQLFGGSNTKITPLFEKMLSASDAGKIGRLVLPKKCAEAYLPPISEPEGYPLVIQDLKGKDWVLQYRFWPNNNSRMYVLEGITPCIQSMQLQAGDTVTFSRLEPEGKLIMGFRKASLVYPSQKGNETINTTVSTHEETSNDSKLRYPDGTWCGKRKKGGNMCSNSKLMGEQMIQLSVTLERVQGLLQPPLTNSPTIVLIDGVEIEVFQEAPIIGSPTESSTDNVGSLHSPTPLHLDRKLPMINHENKESYAPADLADHHRNEKTRHPHHKHGCTCIVCIQPSSGVCLEVKHSTPSPPSTMQTQLDTQVQNPTPLLYADIIRYTQMGNTQQNSNSNMDNKNDQNRANSSFRSQNIDLNMRPEREEEPSPVLDSMEMMRLDQESTQRCIKM